LGPQIIFWLPVIQAIDLPLKDKTIVGLKIAIVGLRKMCLSDGMKGITSKKLVVTNLEKLGLTRPKQSFFRGCSEQIELILDSIALQLTPSYVATIMLGVPRGGGFNNSITHHIMAQYLVLVYDGYARRVFAMQKQNYVLKKNQIQLINFKKYIGRVSCKIRNKCRHIDIFLLLA